MILLHLAALAIISIHFVRAEFGESCRLPDKNLGVCIPAKHCKVAQRLEDQENTLNGTEVELEETIKKLDCGTFYNVTHICCSESDFLYNPQGLEILEKTKCGIYNEHISYGYEAGIGQFPWMALLIFEDGLSRTYDCGGSLLNEYYVLTAAHCFDNLKDKKVIVRLGEHRISLPRECKGTLCTVPVDIKVKERILHPAYAGKNNDIALLRLEQKVNFTLVIRPICLPIYSNPPQNKYTVSGWGITEKSRGRGSDVLMFTELYPSDMSKCNECFHQNFDNNTHLCNSGAGDSNTCAGDSGGPLGQENFYGSTTEQRFIQYGVISVGVDACGDFHAPSVCTRVKFFLPWITEHIKP